MAAIVRDEPVAASEIVPTVPPELEKLIARALRKDLERRWQSMADLKVAFVEMKEEVDSRTTAAQDKAVTVASRLAGQRWLQVTAGLLLLGTAAAWLYLARSEKLRPPPRILPLTTFPGYESDPALSPDGKQVAFVWDGGNPGAPAQLYLQLIGGGDPLQLSKGPAGVLSPAWSPDRGQIAFLRHQEKNDRLHDIFVIPALGGPERRLGTCLSTEGHALSWSPDGKVLAIADRSAPEEPDAIFLLSTETGEKRRFTSPPAGIGGDVQPVFSPDGTRVAFARVRVPTWRYADLTCKT